MVEFVKPDDEDNGEKRFSKKKTKGIFSWKLALLVFLIFFFLSSLLSSLSYMLSPKIAVVPIKGVITSDSSSGLLDSSSTSSRFISQTLLSLKDDDSIKAVVLDINSPGGSPVATEEISHAIDALKEKKPVIALVGEIGASGAFWIAMSADKVYASRMSTLGSIGVTSASLGFEEFIKEYNVSYRRLTAGEFKDMGSQFREMTDEEKEKIQNILDEIHSYFIAHVAQERGLEYSEVEKIATGEVFLGTKAKELGFVDEFGYFSDVQTELEKEQNSELLVVTYGPEPSFAEALGLRDLFSFSLFGSGNANSVGMLE